jgi:cell division GTPase FtsZ
MDFLVNAALQQHAAQPQHEDSDLIGQAKIRVIGCGGSGNNMVGWLYKKGVKGAEILACNTDKQHLQIIEADKKFLIGKGVTRGLGCGGFPEKGAESAKESIQELKEYLKGSDMVFVCAGMNGLSSSRCTGRKGCWRNRDWHGHDAFQDRKGAH